MKRHGIAAKQMNRTQMLERLCSGSSLLLSLLCCVAWINVELRIQEHHRLISHSAKFCDKIETEIIRKVQKNYARWQFENTRRGEDGKFCYVSRHLFSCSSRLHRCSTRIFVQVIQHLKLYILGKRLLPSEFFLHLSFKVKASSQVLFNLATEL